MGFFKSNYNKPGPGVPKDAPPKKGVPRFFEIIFRDFSALWCANFITMLCCIPCFAALIIGEAFNQYIGMVLICSVVFIIGCCLAAPAMAALFGTVIKSVRDIPGYMWHDYKKFFASNAKQAIPIGIVASVLFVLDYVMIKFYSTQTGNTRFVMFALITFGLLLITGCAIFCFAQMIVMELPLTTLVKNSFMLLLGYVKRSLPGTLIALAFLGITFGILTWPFALVLAFIFGMPVFVLVIVFMWIWPVMETAFKITEKQNEKRERENATDIPAAWPPAQADTASTEQDDTSKTDTTTDTEDTDK